MEFRLTLSVTLERKAGKYQHVYTFEVSDTVSQLPPVRENFPDPIRRRISSGVSFGPLANGVYLKRQRAD